MRAELAEFLMRQGEPDTVAAGGCQRVGQVAESGDVVLDFVDVDVDGRAVNGRCGDAAEDGVSELRRDQRAEQAGALDTDDALAERDE